MKKGGLKDENIIVFMYDDIAYNEENPRPGVIINHPQGGDVYEGVPKVRLYRMDNQSIVTHNIYYHINFSLQLLHRIMLATT